MTGGRRYLFFTNECVGLGHLRRALSLADALAASDDSATSLIVSGAPIAPGSLPPRSEIISLPQLARDEAGLRHARHLRIELERTHSMRAQLALAAATAFEPDVAIVDKTPLGLADELVPALAALKRGGSRIALGLRDIDDSASDVQRRWNLRGTRDAIRRYYDRILVYGTEDSPDALDCLGWADLGVPVHHVGYVGRALPVRGPADLPARYLLATPGGGADGFELLAAFLEAVRLRPLPLEALVVTGPLMPRAHAERLRGLAEGLDVVVTGFRTDMDAVIAGATGVVSMAGYNTVAELLRAAKPALLVPREHPSREQLVRAEQLEAAGLVAVLRPDRLTPAVLRDALDRLLVAPAPQVDLTEYDGAARAAAVLAHLSAAAPPELAEVAR